MASANLRGPKRSIGRKAFIEAAAASSAFALTAKLIVEERFLASETALTDQALSGRRQAVFNRRLRKTQLAQFRSYQRCHLVVHGLQEETSSALFPLPTWQERRVHST